MHEFLVDLLVCPECHDELIWYIDDRRGDHIQKGEARCLACKASYLIRDGIGMFLVPSLHREDLWQQVDSHLLGYLRKHRLVARRLMEVPLTSLAPADQFFRALVLEERGEYQAAREAEALAQAGLYTADYLQAFQCQLDYLAQRLASAEAPIFDLASGRGYLIEHLIPVVNQPLIASDFSLQVLFRNRRWLEERGLEHKVTLLAFDARQTPFRDKSLDILTTNLGLPNVSQPEILLHEIRRITAGEFLAVHHFYPETDQPNRAALSKVGLADLTFAGSAWACFAEAGLQLEQINVVTGAACPTPTGVILNGAVIDAFPVAETTLEWCVLQAQ